MCHNIQPPIMYSPRPHKIEVTGGVVVREVPSELWDTRLVVVSVLGVELYIAVAVQKHQLHRNTVNMKARLVKNADKC